MTGAQGCGATKSGDTMTLLTREQHENQTLAQRPAVVECGAEAAPGDGTIWQNLGPVAYELMHRGGAWVCVKHWRLARRMVLDSDQRMTTRPMGSW
jgi:hypothetical protein